MTKPIISVITPVFNKWELTEQCLKSLFRHTPKGIAEYIFINNASTDETSTNLEPLGKQLFGDYFTAIHCQQNINFGPASNLGAKTSKADLLFFLNNDTVVTPNWHLPLLQHTINEKNFGAVGPLLLYPDNTVQHLGVSFSTMYVCHLYVNFPHTHKLVSKKRRLNFITGAALLTSRQTFEAVGGFYPEYANGYEDLDLCHQIRKKKLSITCEPKSVIYHLESQTPGRHKKESENSRLLMERIGKEINADLHHHAVRDGLHAGINDKADIYICLGAEESQSLQAAAGTEDKLQELLASNPLWLEGYIKYAKMLDTQKRFAEASLQWEKALRIKISKEFCLAMKKSALAGGNQSMENIADSIMEDIEQHQQISKFIIQDVLKKAYKTTTGCS